ncbi:MAG: DUF6164 family protein [Wenzhouxiangella sp.]
MPKLLLNLRDVPEDEIEEVLALMEAHRFSVYRTPRGIFGVTPGGIWLREAEDYPDAKRVMDGYQEERARKAQAAYARAVEEGRADTWWSLVRRHPVKTLVHLGLAIFILMVFFAPMIQLGRG